MSRSTHTETAATQLRSTFFTLLVCLASLSSSGSVEAQIATPAVSGNVSRAVASSRLVGSLPRSRSLTLALGLPLRNQAELDSFLVDLTDPASANYRQYLTPEQFAERFGPSEADYQALIQFAEQHNLTVTQTHGNRAVLTVTGAVPDVEQAFNVHLNTYQHPARGQFFAPDREPTMPGAPYCRTSAAWTTSRRRGPWT